MIRNSFYLAVLALSAQSGAAERRTDDNGGGRRRQGDSTGLVASAPRSPGPGRPGADPARPDSGRRPA